MKTLMASGWVVWFLIAFFNSRLPNNSPFTDTDGTSRDLFRSDIWQLILDSAPAILNPFDYTFGADDTAGWGNLRERLPFMAVALQTWFIVWCIGWPWARRVSLKVQLLRSERLVLTFGIGTSLFSVWILACGLSGLLRPWILWLPAIVSVVSLGAGQFRCRLNAKAGRSQTRVTGTGVCQRSDAEPLNSSGDTSDTNAAHNDPEKASARPNRRHRLNTGCIVCGLLLAPFVVHILLGGMTPPFDFDVREYHLEGPKEWFLAGEIHPLRHNVYTSFPFLSEMVCLAAMVLAQDWWAGAVAGKLAISSFQLMSVLCVYAIGRRWFSREAGYIAALALITTPWTIRISIIAYAEGAVTFYVIATVMLCLLWVQVQPSGDQLWSLAIGFFSGSAMASKYPGLVTAVFPAVIVLAVNGRRQVAAAAETDNRHHIHGILTLSVFFGLGLLFSIGPWMLRNTAWHGNPVYPLADSLFHSRDWSSEMDQKWGRAHGPGDHHLAGLPHHIADVAMANDWQNGLLFACLIPALLFGFRDPQVRSVLLWSTWILFSWWAFTHRIDRFWIPVVPLLAVLCGAAWARNNHGVWRSVISAAVLITLVFNYGFSRLPVVGFHAGLMKMESAARLPVRSDIRILNTSLPQDARVLMVGEAEVFDMKFPVVYNTVFDDSIFELWLKEEGGSSRNSSMKPAEQIHSILQRENITHIYVNWSEILRYRLPGSYGFTDFVMPIRFRSLLENHVLEDPVCLRFSDWTGMNDQARQEVTSWEGADDLIREDGTWKSIQLYRVASHFGRQLPAIPSGHPGGR